MLSTQRRGAAGAGGAEPHWLRLNFPSKQEAGRAKALGIHASSTLARCNLHIVDRRSIDKPFQHWILLTRSRRAARRGSRMTLSCGSALGQLDGCRVQSQARNLRPIASRSSTAAWHELGLLLVMPWCVVSPVPSARTDSSLPLAPASPGAHPLAVATTDPSLAHHPQAACA